MEYMTGDGGDVVLPKLAKVQYRAHLGDKVSPSFADRQSARDWITAQRLASGDHDSASLIDQIVGT